jgi:hypothetical protein
MTNFATNISGVAASIVTSLQSAQSNAATLATNMGPNFPGTTLGNLATSTLGWRMNVADLRVALNVAINDLSRATQEFTTISNLLSSIDSND